MKHFVINLERRVDRRKIFINQKPKFEYEFFKAYDGRDFSYMQNRVLKSWVDPSRGTTTTDGEIGCFLSHYALWEKCVKLNEPIVIFEDDVELFDYNESISIEASRVFNFFYLARNPMAPDRGTYGKYVLPGYSYWLAAYTITPKGARYLMDTDVLNNLVAADEYVPCRLGVNPYPELDRFKGDLDSGALPYNVVDQFSRYILGSDLEDEQNW
jgi:GR25 family glycosyltransferase involved in LPS biosynthesis